MPKRLFGTFSGVFTPTTITILGVIMYLRQGWVVGNAGLLGTWLIIAISISIAACTALSLSSIATNTRLHAGGAYAIISRSLGMEAGGSIGIALYLAQTLAVTMYIFGFREGWLSIFPSHPALLIDLLAFAGVFGIAVTSANFATRVQYLVLAITAVSLVCIGLGPWRHQPESIQWWGDFSAAGGGYIGFWKAFAVYFPAVTGVMAGANMSGELRDPSKSIPKGTLTAVGVCALIYFWLAYAMTRMAPPAELMGNYSILTEKAWGGWVVEMAILCATSSSALATLVGAPRILQALAADGALPRGGWLEKLSSDGEPRNAMALTGCIALAGLCLRDLNDIAPLITIFFLATYAAVNGVVLIEQGLGLVSFRPLLRLPQSVPFIGAIGSLLAMVIINPAVSIAALSVLLLTYAALTRRKKSHEQGDVRSNIFIAFARWAARETQALPESEARAWLPHPVTPILDGQHCRNGLELASDISYPKGSVKLLRIGQDPKAEPMLHKLVHEVRSQGVFCTGTEVQVEDRTVGLIAAIQALQGTLFRPNILSIGMDDGFETEELAAVIAQARMARMGVVLRCQAQQKIGMGGLINVWIRPQPPEWSISVAQAEGNLDLTLLVSLRLAQRHSMSLRLITTLDNPDQRHLAIKYLGQITEVARLPRSTALHAIDGDLWTCLSQAPDSAVNIFGLPSPYNPEFIDRILKTSPKACLFVQSSGLESVLV
jgi:solute carrier family 12 (sodium/potassium/chloride transporter), member 2